MHRTWTTAIAAMVLMQGAQAASTPADVLPEAHTIIGEESTCGDIAPHRADDATWRSAARRVCEAMEQTRRLVTRLAEHVRSEGGDGAAMQTAERLTGLMAACGRPCEDAYEEALSALGVAQAASL